MLNKKLQTMSNVSDSNLALRMYYRCATRYYAMEQGINLAEEGQDYAEAIEHAEKLAYAMGCKAEDLKEATEKAMTHAVELRNHAKDAAKKLGQ